MPNLLQALGTAGFSPDDDAETRLKKSLLIFATGLVSLGSMLWLLLYWQMGPRFSSTAPFLFQCLLVANLVFFMKSGNFSFFRYSQLALFLFAPFVVQWSIGNFITASGTILWGLLAPVGAMLWSSGCASRSPGSSPTSFLDRPVGILRLLPRRRRQCRSSTHVPIPLSDQSWCSSR